MLEALGSSLNITGKNYLSEEGTRLAMVGESFPGIHGFGSAQKTNEKAGMVAHTCNGRKTRSSRSSLATQ